MIYLFCSLASSGVSVGLQDHHDQCNYVKTIKHSSRARRSKPVKEKLATMNQFYIFIGDFFAHPSHNILLKNNATGNFGKGNISGAFYIP